MAGKVLSQRRAVPDEIEQPGAAKATPSRSQVGQAAYDLNVQQYCCAGLNFGYFYDRSPIIAYDGAEPPAYTMADFTPSRCRAAALPHLVAARTAGRSMTRSGRATRCCASTRMSTVAPLVGGDARRRRAVRGGRYRPTAKPSRPARRKLVLARTDQHVAWRGDAVPDDPAPLMGKLLGRAGETVPASA